MKIIGYTTGVYDLFHVGHLNLLTKARAECDYLIVGVTSDALSLSRKGKAPIIPQEERMEIVRELRCVDEVVIQDNMNKFEVWEKYRFHRMFVGDDWKGSPSWNALEEQFSTVGVEIVYFPYTAHTSSTHLREVLDLLVTSSVGPHG
ncbi:adenylyltransferase/cytidyltransferase family protein [Alcaligenes faecalis]|uniref:adenylyltransferase/cytidyltransferase family protein n=1 Tax=Alcaligenes faecalis TaxID=511 RepID=UPI00137C3EB6|nr:adenylyltransferase/cytidyltransferase family protein [Alcaligenes faecalis]QHS37170.1 adenylyltransferase/cytidyltransferase family protein [Alcaligenes faecalis]